MLEEGKPVPAETLLTKKSAPYDLGKCSKGKPLQQDVARISMKQ